MGQEMVADPAMAQVTVAGPAMAQVTVADPAMAQVTAKAPVVVMAAVVMVETRIRIRIGNKTGTRTGIRIGNKTRIGTGYGRALEQTEVLKADHHGFYLAEVARTVIHKCMVQTTHRVSNFYGDCR
jgi:uncharacterized protein YcfJ